VDEHDFFRAAGEGYPAELVGVELRTECPKCGAPLAVDGLEREVVCRACSAEIALDNSVFAAALDGCYVDAFRMGAGVTASDHAEVDGRDVHWERGPGGPVCGVCGAPAQVVDRGAGYGCPEHGKQGSVLPAPSWLKSVDFTLEGYVPPRADEDTEGEERRISTRCTNCGSALESDGARRAVECSYCKTINVLPEEVWQALNPPRAPRRFWILCRLFYDPRRETPSAWAEIKDGLGTLGCGAVILMPLILAAVAAIVFAGSWLIETFGQGGAVVVWIVGGVVAIGLLIYLSGYLRRYLRWRRIYKTDQELIGRLGPFEDLSGGHGAVEIGLERPGAAGVVAAHGQMMTRDDYDRLGGEGGTVRAWMVPDREDLIEVRLEPSVLS
jgi:DNA-directed RNA polymerase subunit RPC12/RpoP